MSVQLIDLDALERDAQAALEQHFAYETQGVLKGVLMCPECSDFEDGHFVTHPCDAAHLASHTLPLITAVRAGIRYYELSDTEQDEGYDAEDYSRLQDLRDDALFAMLAAYRPFRKDGPS